MKILWELEGGFVKDIRERMPEPRPAYNTVSTIVRILESKGFVKHETFGKSHKYLPAVSREKYSRFALKKLVKGYFEGSMSQMLSFFAKSENLSAQDLDELIDTLENKKDNRS